MFPCTPAKFSHNQATIFGLVFGAENALLAHETEQRRKENIIRREARFDLARRGIVATETEIAKWKESRDSEYT